MTLVRREAFVTALRDGILWYATAQQDLDSDAAEALAHRFANAVDHTIDKVLRRPGSGVIWNHRAGYRFSSVKRSFDRWLIFTGYPTRQRSNGLISSVGNATCPDG